MALFWFGCSGRAGVGLSDGSGDGGGRKYSLRTRLALMIPEYPRTYG